MERPHSVDQIQRNFYRFRSLVVHCVTILTLLQYCSRLSDQVCNTSDFTLASWIGHDLP